ncbi:MAG: DUF1284 domain-containing protein [Methanobacteriaceae archaeon]|jgi:hypothetical protein|nr:DUF1284 domain-containing protein [Candidatus Methanorudis spinitermitis]
MEKKDNIIKLRAHHLLCLQGYQGYGYSEKFKENLEKKLNILKNNNTKVILTNSPDDFCEKCPNLKENICIKNSKSLNESLKNNDKIVKMDSAILKKTKLEKNKEYSYAKLIKIVNNVFSNKKDLKYICKDCSWANKCLWYTSREI